MFDEPNVSPHRVLFIGMMILALCGGLGFLGGVLLGGEVGFWAFLGLGVGVVISVFLMSLVVFRNLIEPPSTDGS